MHSATENIAGGTFMTRRECGLAISMNSLWENPIQSATDILRHVLAHKASRLLLAGERIIPELEPVRILCGRSVRA
jgi:hypothetical protein